MNNKQWKQKFRDILFHTPVTYLELEDFISALLKEREAEIRKEEYDRCIKVLDIDHNNCLSPESCIGYQNALSNLINNPPQ
jgi:Ca2+-binding EF-hand superfamily protein